MPVTDDFLSSGRHKSAYASCILQQYLEARLYQMASGTLSFICSKYAINICHVLSAFRVCLQMTSLESPGWAHRSFMHLANLMSSFVNVYCEYWEAFIVDVMFLQGWRIIDHSHQKALNLHHVWTACACPVSPCNLCFHLVSSFVRPFLGHPACSLRC